MKKYLKIIKCIVPVFSKLLVGRIKKLLFFLFWSALTFAQTSPISLGELQPFWRSQPVLGPYLQDGINTTEIPDFMLQTDFPYQKRSLNGTSFTKEVPFADNLSVVRLLGGYSKYPGVTGTLTDLTTAEGITLLNQLRDYDFAYKNNGVLTFRPELIQNRLQPYLALGYEDLTVVLDNIPWDLTTNTNASLNSYGNKGVPNSSQEWYDTISELCTTLIGIMGTEKANKLRFRIGTEMNGLERFNGTEAQFINHYDNAAAAIQFVLPGATLSLFNISSNTFSNINNVHNVGAFRVLNHIANENNQKTGAKLTNIPNFVSFSEYFYEATNFTTEVSNSDQVWDYVNNNIAGYQNKFSREIHDWNATIPTANEGAFGGAMTLQVFMKYMEVGVDRIYHWNAFRSIPDGSVRYQIPTSQAWIYSVLDYLSGGAVYKITPDVPTIARAATITSMLSVKNGKSYLLVNSFDPDKTNTQVSEVVVRIPKSYLPSISLAETKITSLTNTNCVLNEIRRDVENANNLNPDLASKPDYIPSNLQDLCVDYTAFKAMVLDKATKYENLWKESLTLDPFDGNITEEGDNFVIKLNMTATQNTVIVFYDTKKTGTLTASPQVVTAFTNLNGTGNSTISWSTQNNSPRTLVTLTRTLVDGTEVGETFVSIKNNNPTGSATRTISEGLIHTFKLYTGEIDSDVLGDLLDTVIVYGGDNFLVYNGAAWVNAVAMDGTTAAKNAYIYDNLTLSSNAEINNLEVAPGGSLTINAGVSLKVNGTSSGNVTYNTTLGTENWYLVSSPVAGETYDGAYVTANSLAINGTNNAIATYTTGTNTWSYMQTGGGATFTPGTGYYARRATAAGSGTISFTGTINTSDVAASVVLGGTDGFNLIGNPFTAYLNSASFLTGNTANLVSETMWVWNEATANYETKVTADAFVLAPTQGFFVSASSATNLSIAESYQATTGSAFQKTTKTEVKLMINDGTSSRFAKVYYLDNATTGFDNGFDGETFGGIANTVDVFTHLVADSEGKNYQIQSLPNSDFETMVIPVGITADAGKEITFTAEAMNLQEGLKVFLEDKVTNAMTRLDQANATYKVTLNDALNGIGRFYVHTKASGVLSTTDVTLQNVSVYTTDKTILRVVGLSQGKASVKLYNMLGKQVFATSFNSVGVKDMNLPTLATGMYIVQLETAAGKLNKKIVLE
jgi:hypothetical protein